MALASEWLKNRDRWDSTSTPGTRERILAAMTWQESDQIPLTIYDWMIPAGTAERELREMGLGIITRLPAHRVEHHQVQYDSIVEAFTPAPVGDLTVAKARAAWPDKALWLNFTSSMHLQPEETIAAHTRQLIEEAGSKRGFAIGITEDIPAQHCARSLRVIARTIQDLSQPTHLPCGPGVLAPLR